jgi:hypothetical protein
LQKIFAAGDTAKIGPATGAAGRSDRRHQKDDVEVRRNCQQGEVEQKEGSNNNSSAEAAATAAEWSG